MFLEILGMTNLESSNIKLLHRRKYYGTVRQRNKDTIKNVTATK